MTTAKDGDRVRVHYTLTLDDGSQIDSSRDRGPFEFQIGSGQVIKGFDIGVTGMNVGDERSVIIEPADGYGEWDENRIVKVDRKQLPPTLSPEVGQQLMMQTAMGQPIPVTVHSVSDTHVDIDANHHLAGKRLNFDIELLEILD